MKIICGLIILVFAAFSGIPALHAQEPAQTCRVEMKSLAGRYTGDCKNGFAHGNGEARGFDHYIGNFNKGLPDGKGVYYYGDSIYYSGNFQEGLKEGKGEAHFMQSGRPDSIIKGYWSADEYRGSKYTTYAFDGATMFDSYEITPSAQGGNSVTFDISTTSGAPDGSKTNFNGASGFVLTLNSITSTSGIFIQKLSDFVTANKFSVTYELSKFPASLFITLSNGQSFSLELYKAARWKVRLYQNK